MKKYKKQIINVHDGKTQHRVDVGHMAVKLSTNHIALTSIRKYIITENLNFKWKL
jgi:methyl coenzyme M reductase subunit D